MEGQLRVQARGGRRAEAFVAEVYVAIVLEFVLEFGYILPAFVAGEAARRVSPNRRRSPGRRNRRMSSEKRMSGVCRRRSSACVAKEEDRGCSDHGGAVARRHAATTMTSRVKIRGGIVSTNLEVC